MQQVSFSNDKLYEIARENYNKMFQYCIKLDDEGYWEQAFVVLKQPISKTLDLYIQSMLTLLSIYCNRLTEREKQFIITLPNSDAIGLGHLGNEEQAVNLAKKIVASPPIILQLFGVMDAEKHTSFSGEFFDCLLNIMLALAYINDKKDPMVNRFVQEYYQRVYVFLNRDVVENCINPRYVFRKLSCLCIEDSVGLLLEDKKKQKIYKEAQQITEELERKGKLKIHVPTLEELKDKYEEEKEKKIESNEEEYQQLYGYNNIEEELDRQEELENQKDFSIETEEEPQEEPVEHLDELLEELNQLIGLKEVKEEIHSLINLIKVRKKRESFGLPTMDMTYHMVFTGNPGTGKTTVARLVAEIYKELGILSKGTLIETDRSGLVAGYVGQTAIKVKETVEKALGGVLFIDEAYSLTNNNVNNDFGSEAIDMLVKMMEDNRDDLVIIVAGYTEEMKDFLKSNTGLVSRFNKFISFPDYTIEELMCILETMGQKSGFTFVAEAKEVIQKALENMIPEKKLSFGNARGIRNLFEKIVVNQANRVVELEDITKEKLTTIILEDVERILSV